MFTGSWLARVLIYHAMLCLTVLADVWAAENTLY